LTQLEQTGAATPSAGRRDEILQAPEALLRDGGLEGFSMRRLADKVGIKLASLQYHFRSKGLLMQALIGGSLLITGEGRLPHKELSGLAKETRHAALMLALSD
jgi:AcrR family transcriptional regulator